MLVYHGFGVIVGEFLVSKAGLGYLIVLWWSGDFNWISCIDKCCGFSCFSSIMYSVCAKHWENGFQKNIKYGGMILKFSTFLFNLVAGNIV